MASAEANLVVLGDVMLSHPVKGPGGALSDPVLRTELAQADLVVANLEGPFTDRGYPADKTIVFRSPPELAPALTRLGIHVVSVANNHALDYGPEGLFQSMELTRAAGVGIAGGGRNRGEALEPVFVERNGVRMAFISVACTLPPGFAASAERPGIAPIRVMTQFVVDSPSIDETPGVSPYVRTFALQEDVDRVLAAVRTARANADVVVVSIHWGIPHGWVAEFQDVLAEYQRPLAHALVESGAALVVGHHSHCLHGIERHGSGWILYSTGNFLFHTVAKGSNLALNRSYPPYRLDSLRSRVAQESALFRVRISRKGVERLSILPVLLDDNGEPVVLRSREAEVVLARVEAYSRSLGVGLEREGDQAVAVAR